jgi:Polyketide cyclase / dehydrase and lipid transport
MNEIHDSAQARLDVSADSAFACITDIERLPQWNAAIGQVIDRPAELGPGAQWTVRMQPNRLMRWGSRSTVAALDWSARRFSYRTVNTDGNPSSALWSWQVDPAGPGCDVRVRWDIRLETLDRRMVAGPIRRRQLRREVAASLRQLEAAARTAAAGAR